MASFGMSNVRVPKPSFTYTNTLERWPPLASTFSAVFVPLQAGSWLMSILAALGASPSSFTTPTMVAAVAGSIGVAAAAGADAAGAGCSSAVSFLPHPASRARPSSAGKLETAIHVFVFMLSRYLSEFLKSSYQTNLFGTAAARATAPVAARRGAAACRSRMSHRRTHATLLLRGQLQDVI